MLPATPAALSADKTPTCNREELDPRSYLLTTEAQARNLHEDRYSWWDAFDLGKHQDALGALNETAAWLAERAIEIDPRNLMAHSLLARQYLALQEPERAEEAWRATLDGGGAVVWSATLYDVDARTYFFLAFDRRSLRVYQMAQLAGEVKRGFYGIPEFPGPRDRRFYEAVAGCLDPGITPQADVPWSQVREIKAGNYVLWFKLTRPIEVASDRTGKKEKIREIKVALHGATGDLEVYKPVGEDRAAMRGRGPAWYQDMIRRTLVKFVDPEKRIALPPSKPGVGW
jgi:hypothetical protein